MKRLLQKTDLHFDLSFMNDERVALLHVGTERHPLIRHDEESLAKHKELNAALALAPAERITHYVEGVPLPQEAAQLLMVSTASQCEGEELPTLLMTTIHIPRSAREDAIDHRLETKHPNIHLPHPKLAAYGLNCTMASNKQAIIDVHDYKTAMDAATTLVSHHVELINIGPKTASLVSTIVEYANGISDLATSIYTQAMAHQKNPNAQNWVYETPYLDKNLQPSKKKRYAWSDTTKIWVKGPMSESLKQSKNDPSLKSNSSNAGLYTVQKGVANVSEPQHGTSVLAENAAIAGSSWTLNNLTPHHGFEKSSGISFNNNEFAISFTNSWLRWLSGYVEFYGPNGQSVQPKGWSSQAPSGLANTYDSDTKKYVAIFSAVNTILAIPVGNSPTDIKFPWPSNASSVKIMAGGIGRTGGIQSTDGTYVGSWDAQVCTAGAIMTGVFNFGIPVACLVAGALVQSSSLSAIAKTALGAILDVGATLINGPVSSGIQGGNTLTILTAFADLIPRLLLAVPELLAWLSAEVAVGVAQEAEPIFGWIATAVSVITDVALLTETSVEVASSPAVFEIIASRSIDASWTLLPDVKHQGEWPRVATHYEVVATYKDGTTRSTQGKLNPPSTGPITVKFNKDGANKLPAGGDVSFTASFYSDTGWLAGIAKTGFLSADVPNILTVPQMNITENLVPLSAKTQYQFDQKLVYDSVSKSRTWSKTGGAPTATIKDLDASNIGNNISKLVNLAVSQKSSEVGYTWEASGQDIPLAGQSSPFTGQMFTFQGIDDRDKPDDQLRFVPFGFTPQPLLLFEVDIPKSGNGYNFWVDPRSSLYHVREIIMNAKSTPFDLSAGQSWGRFNHQMDAATLHPAGVVIGINTTTSKLEILRLGESAVADADAPLANLYSGYGTRPGLLHGPVGVAATPVSAVIVLESADSMLPNAEARLQAFDLLSNPAPIFKGGSSVAALYPESLPVTVLDIAIETKGFIYVLKYLGAGNQVNDYRLDLYNPDGTWLSQTVALSAGKIAVDIWRTLYTLNFETLAKPSGGRTEPSVSIWLPTTPN